MSTAITPHRSNSAHVHRHTHWDSVFTKTNKGRTEIAQRSGGLSAKQRSILIMLDGSKKLHALVTPVAKNELEEIVGFLAHQELIEQSDNAANTHSNATLPAASVALPLPVMPDLAGMPEPTPTIIAETLAPAINSTNWALDTATLRKIKDFMTTTAQTYLGLLGADVIRRIERAEDSVQLMSILGQWHMALRDSKQGHRFASVYMEQVSAALRGDTTALALL